jgi:hypothetical protein
MRCTSRDLAMPFSKASRSIEEKRGIELLKDICNPAVK